MSIASLILALLPAVAAKIRQPQPEKTKRERELERQVETLTFALDYQREAASVIQAQNERLTRERDALLRRLEESHAEAMRHVQARYAQLQNAQMQQHAQALQQSNMFAQQNAYHQGLLGMQQNVQWHDCTCVPDRASALRGA